MIQRKLNLGEFAVIQDRLNEYTIPNWKGELVVGDFKLAAFAELYELMESTNWKWWKQSDQFDPWNLKVEAIDVFHFLLSNLILNKVHEYNPDCAFGTSMPLPNTFIMDDGKLDRTEFINTVTQLLVNGKEQYLDDFFCDMGMCSEEIAALYTAKSELNFIRQDSGYKDGTYIKIQDGIEDNVKLEVLVTEFMTDDTMCLSTLRKNVKDSFFS